MLKEFSCSDGITPFLMTGLQEISPAHMYSYHILLFIKISDIGNYRRGLLPPDSVYLQLFPNLKPRSDTASDEPEAQYKKV